MSGPPAGDGVRPRAFALLLLASGDVRPRQRARDQQADRAGLELKRRVLERLVALDPEASELEASLARIIEEFGPPTGPTRGIALIVREEWRAANGNPEVVAHLLAGAVREGETGSEGRPRGRRVSP